MRPGDTGMGEGTRTALGTAALFLAVVALWGVARALAPPETAGVWPDGAFALMGAVALFAFIRIRTSARDQQLARLRHLVHQPLAGVYVIQDGRFRFVNHKFAEMLGYEPAELVEGVAVEEVIHEDDLAEVRERMEARLEGASESVNHAFRVVRRDGAAVDVEVWGNGARWEGHPAVVGLMLDQTPDRARARQVRRSQQLEAIGEFTGAVAHDFNNLLTAIITPVQLALTDMEATHPLRRQLEEVEGAATRGASLSKQLLAFSRKQVVKPRPHDLNEIVDGLRPMLDRLVGAAIQMEVETDPALSTVVVDPTQMEQVLVNLVVNARDAMPGGGRVCVRTANVDPTLDPVRSEGAVPPAGHVRLVVEDTGAGFDEAVRKRIFEPYYTTKEHGTGLGLSTVFGIARQFGGFVRVESTPGVGSTFAVYLPAVSGAAEPVARSRPRPSTLAGGSEQVLVVEDQEPVRQVVVRALTRFGYRVVEAGSGEEAMELARELGADLDLVVSDVMLPGRTGPELVEDLVIDRPNLRVLYISGYADQDAFAGVEAGQDWLFLAKPFSVEELLTRVRVALDRAPLRTDAGST